jgi:hypothetical protein
VTRLTHRRCRGVSGSGKPIRVARKIVAISPILQEMRKVTKVCMLVYMLRPSSTALTMDAKLSSTKIISAAALATSVPVIPIAMPMSACRRAEASFTPSPVIAESNCEGEKGGERKGEGRGGDGCETLLGQMNKRNDRRKKDRRTERVQRVRQKGHGDRRVRGLQT